MIAGRELSETLFARLAAGAQARVLGELGRFLRALHGLPPDLAGG